tara:strand:- start:127 stop:408 length:282 start_codon:yes stop_codon:yes gene_type:complete
MKFATRRLFFQSEEGRFSISAFQKRSGVRERHRKRLYIVVVIVARKWFTTICDDVFPRRFYPLFLRAKRVKRERRRTNEKKKKKHDDDDDERL